jgi:ABC-type uncharacterized transport system permease subunit
MQLASVFFGVAFVGYLAVLGVFVRRMVRSGSAEYPGFGSQSWLLSGAFGVHTVSIITRGVVLGQCPMFSLHDSLSFMAWAIILVCLLLKLGYRSSPMEIFVPMVAVLLLAVAAISGGNSSSPARLPSPALISLHAGLYFLGYAAFVITFLASGLYLLLEHQLKRRQLNAFASNLGSLDTMDKIHYLSLGVGVLCLTAGIAIGLSLLGGGAGSWARSILNDPKIVLALITWVLYMGLLLARSTNRLRGRKVAYWSIAGFLLVCITFLSANHLAKVF